MAPGHENVRGIEEFNPKAVEKEVEAPRFEKIEAETLADKLENSRVLYYITVALGLIAIGYEVTKGLSRALNLDTVNFICLIVGLMLYGNPIRYARAFYECVPAVGGVILQFPFYAGIFGLLNTKLPATGVSAAMVLADKIASVATPLTWPIIAWLIAAFVNLFIPSGGGEWAAIGEILMRAGYALGVPVGKTIIAYAASDAWTNLLQPFWAIPVLAITGTKARDIFGYTVALMLLTGPAYAIGLTFMPYKL